jgi:integrase
LRRNLIRSCFVPIHKGCHVSDRVVLRAAFVDACNAADLNGLRLHDLRHFQGHQASRVANLPEVMRRMGHSTQQAAMIFKALYLIGMHRLP